VTPVSFDMEGGRVRTRCSRTNISWEKNSSAPCDVVEGPGVGGQGTHRPRKGQESGGWRGGRGVRDSSP